MAKYVALLLTLINGYKTYSSVILAIVSGLGMILTKNFSGGLSSIFQALTLIFGGASIVGLRGALAQLVAAVQVTPSQPTPSQPTPSQPAPSQPTPNQPAPSEPAKAN